MRAWVLLFGLLLGACASAPPQLAEPAPEPAPVRMPPAPPAAPPQPAKFEPFEGPRREIRDPLPRVAKVDGTVAPRDLWERIRRGFAMPDLETALVRRKTREYAVNREALQKILNRARPYLFHIVEEIEKRGLPTELALLPMVESAFNPMAYSRASASGLWQFIPGTGRRYELEQNWWYDGRRDVIDSTGAALDYLTELYRMHRDWHLALASYNWGEGAVKRAIATNRAKGRRTDYASLRMPRETAHYVPKLQALENIIRDPGRYSVDIEPIPDEPYFVVITATPEIDVQLAAQLAEMPVEDFVALNPGFSRPVIRTEAASRIVLPWDRVGPFHDNLAKRSDGELVSWEVYRPKKGETLGKIARKFGLSIAELKRVNGIPQRSWRVPRLLAVPADRVERQPPARSVHVVERGDTLSEIAERYGVPLEDLRRWNRLRGPLQIGQEIVLEKPVT